MTPLDLTNRFDGAAAWAALPDALKATIGAVVLERCAAHRLYDGSPHHSVPARVAVAADDLAEAALDRLFAEALGLDPMSISGTPPIPSLLGMVCECCGCSENDACPGGCGWARDSLCTACVGVQP